MTVIRQLSFILDAHFEFDMTVRELSRKKTFLLVGIMNYIINSSRIAVLFLVGIFLTCEAVAQNNFTFSYLTVFDSQASDYIVSAVNVQRYSEWQSPPVTYWGPSASGVLGTLTYKFTYGAPSAQISLNAALASFNFGGTETGSSSLWASTDGSSWQLLLNDPTPQSEASYLHYNQNVPSSLLGTTSIWFQVQMEEDSLPSDFALAQFSRSATDQPNDVFNITVTEAPEPSAAWLVLVGGLGMCFLRCQKSLFFRRVLP